MLDALLIIGSSVVIILLLWSAVGVRYLNSLQMSVIKSWDAVLDLLRKRQDKVPFLVELLKQCGETQEPLRQQLIVERGLAAKASRADAIKMEYEHDLSRTINKAVDLGRIYAELGSDVRFLGLRKEMRHLEEDIEAKVMQYTQMVRDFNRQRGLLWLRPLAGFMGLDRLNVFDVES